MNIVFDLDGTLALDDHRKHFLEGEKKDWHSYFDACDGDKPNKPIIETLLALSRSSSRHHIEIWTGRSEGKDQVWRKKTIIWLLKDAGILAPRWGYYGFGHDDLGLIGCHVSSLQMRRHGDYTPDIALKHEWLDEATRLGLRPALVFEDRQRVVDFWRAEGITCVQVAPGDF